MDFTALKTAIQNAVKLNGNEEITGNILQGVLLSIVSTLGDSAINDLVTAISNEATARQNGDSTLNGYIEALQGAVNSINTAIGNGFVYAGIATPTTTPATGKVFYIALAAGTYTNFGNTEVSQGINILKYDGSAWSLDVVIALDDAPTPSSNNLVKSGGVFDKVMTDGSAFDISAHFASGGTLATYADLSAALTALNTLSASYKKGGMSIKFVQSSDNKYVQYRCIAQNFTTDVTQWHGVGNISESVLKGETMNVPLFINGQISTSTGELTPVDTFNGKISTDYYIKCRDVVKLTISQGELYIFYYGVDFAYLGYKGINSATKTEITVDNTDYPSAIYFRVWCNNVQANYKPTFIFVKNNTVNNSESIISLNNRSISVTSPTSITIDTTTNNGYVNYLGNLTTTSSYFYTPLLSFTKGTIITLTSRDPSGSAVVRLSKWKQDGSKMLKAISYGTTTVTTVKYTVVDEIEYLRFSGNKNTTSYEFTANSKYAEAPYEFNSVVKQIVNPLIPDTTYKKHYSYAMWKVLCIGDSLTSGAYYAGGWSGSSIDENYPRILGRMITGDVTNGGHSGVSASDYYLNDLNNYTLSNYDTFIIWLGTNGGLTDTLDTDVEPYTDYNDYAATNTGYYCRIIEKIKEVKPDAFIILTKIFAGPSNPSPATTNQVIDKIAAKYSLMVIDNSDLTVAKHPELHCNIDNPHLGKAGNIVVANRVVDEVSNYLFASPIKAEFGLTARAN